MASSDKTNVITGLFQREHLSVLLVSWRFPLGNNLAPFIIATAATNMMGQFTHTTIWAFATMDGRQRMMGAAHIPTGL